MFRLGQNLWMQCRSLKFPCATHDVLQSRGREFYNSGIQHLTQHWQKRVENDGDFVEK
jgi:hypothetical protein